MLKIGIKNLKKNKEFNKLYVEDFAESVMRYFDSGDLAFRRDFPNRVKVIEQLLNEGL